MWIYSSPQVKPDSECPPARFTVHDGCRIPFSSAGLQEHRFALGLVSALLQAHTERLSDEIAAIDIPAYLGGWLADTGAAATGSGVIEAMLTSAAMLQRWQFFDGYRALGYLQDMANNGLVILLVDPQ